MEKIRFAVLLCIRRFQTSEKVNSVLCCTALGKQRHDWIPRACQDARKHIAWLQSDARQSAGKGCLSGICRGRKTQNQYSSRLCREGARFHGIAVPPYWFHSYIFEIVTIVVYWFCGRGKRRVPTVEPWRCNLMPQCFGRPFS